MSKRHRKHSGVGIWYFPVASGYSSAEKVDFHQSSSGGALPWNQWQSSSISSVEEKLKSHSPNRPVVVVVVTVVVVVLLVCGGRERGEHRELREQEQESEKVSFCGARARARERANALPNQSVCQVSVIGAYFQQQYRLLSPVGTTSTESKRASEEKNRECKIPTAQKVDIGFLYVK